jgi:hypothetical protein
LIDESEGACFCNQCRKNQTSDGLAAIMWWRLILRQQGLLNPQSQLLF